MGKKKPKQKSKSRGEKKQEKRGSTFERHIRRQAGGFEEIETDSRLLEEAFFFV